MRRFLSVLIAIVMCECDFVITAVSAPLLDVLASAAIEQPPLQMPAAASALESQNNADSVAEPMPTMLADAQAAETAPHTSTPVTLDMSFLGFNELVDAPIVTAIPRFL